MDEQQAQSPPLEETRADSEQAPMHEPVAAAAEPQVPKVLTPEEQMALYEKDLKENDWGHQPC